MWCRPTARLTGWRGWWTGLWHRGYLSLRRAVPPGPGQRARLRQTATRRARLLLDRIAGIPPERSAPPHRSRPEDRPRPAALLSPFASGAPGSTGRGRSLGAPPAKARRTALLTAAPTWGPTCPATRFWRRSGPATRGLWPALWTPCGTCAGFWRAELGPRGGRLRASAHGGWED